MALSGSKIQITPREVGWGYFAQFFAIASGVIILPLVLRLLSAEEIGMNYLMISVASLVLLVDFGFSPQFANNIAYVYSGAPSLQKNGLTRTEVYAPGEMNYRLLATLIQTARWLYRLLGGLVLLLMLTAGTAYVYRVTDGFTNVRYALPIWILYSFSVFFQIYYGYYGALLTGSGKIRESKKASVYTSLLKIGLTYFLLLAGAGLLGLVAANLVSPFLTRYLSYTYYFTPGQRALLKPYRISVAERRALFRIIWHNSKKMGICSLSSYLTHGATFMLAGFYLPLSEVASYGLLVQLLTLLAGVSGILFTLYLPRFSSLRLRNQPEILYRESALTFCVFYGLYFVGAFILIAGGNYLLRIAGSQTLLPDAYLVAFASLVWLFDGNAWNCCLLIVSRNEFPFLKNILFTALGLLSGSYVGLAWAGGGIGTLIIVQALAQGMVYDWYWPRYVLREMHTTAGGFLQTGCREIYRSAGCLVKKLK